jgi:hypothetical protein
LWFKIEIEKLKDGLEKTLDIKRKKKSEKKNCLRVKQVKEKAFQ